MREERLKDALESIEPKAGAEERMYRNIRAKAQKKQEEPEKAAPNRWIRQLPLAACIALVILAGGLGIRYWSEPSEMAPPPVGVGTWETEVDGPESFAAFGVFIDAPEQGENVRYFIVADETAKVTFTMEGHEYVYSAAEGEADISGYFDGVTECVSILPEYDGVLEILESGVRKARWEKDGVTCFLCNEDGAEDNTVIRLVRELAEQSGA